MSNLCTGMSLAFSFNQLLFYNTYRFRPIHSQPERASCLSNTDAEIYNVFTDDIFSLTVPTRGGNIFFLMKNLISITLNQAAYSVKIASISSSDARTHLL